MTLLTHRHITAPFVARNYQAYTLASLRLVYHLYSIFSNDTNNTSIWVRKRGVAIYLVFPVAFSKPNRILGFLEVRGWHEYDPAPTRNVTSGYGNQPITTYQKKIKTLQRVLYYVMLFKRT